MAAGLRYLWILTTLYYHLFIYYAHIPSTLFSFSSYKSILDGMTGNDASRAQTRSILHVAVYRIAHRITMNHRFSSSTIPIVIEYYIQKSIRTSLLFDSTQKQK